MTDTRTTTELFVENERCHSRRTGERRINKTSPKTFARTMRRNIPKQVHNRPNVSSRVNFAHENEYEILIRSNPARSTAVTCDSTVVTATAGLSFFCFYCHGAYRPQLSTHRLFLLCAVSVGHGRVSRQ